MAQCSVSLIPLILFKSCSLASRQISYLQYLCKSSILIEPLSRALRTLYNLYNSPFNHPGHSSNGGTTFLAIEDETGEPLITKKWLIPASSDFQTRNRQLTTFQQDLRTMSRLKNSNLVPYTAMEMCKENKRTAAQSVYIFRSFVLGSSLKYLLDKWKNSDKYEGLRLLRHVGLGLFSALTELHSESIVHKDVRCENVYLDSFGTVKLVGASLDLLLTDMLEGDTYCDRLVPFYIYSCIFYHCCSVHFNLFTSSLLRTCRALVRLVLVRSICC